MTVKVEIILYNDKKNVPNRIVYQITFYIDDSDIYKKIIIEQQLSYAYKVF